MIDFACKKFSLNEIIQCSLNLTRLEFRIFEFFIKNKKKWFSTYDISNKLYIGLSTAQKGVKKLSNKNVLWQRQKNIEGGGYFFIYCIKNKSKLRITILNTMQNWIKKTEKEVNNW